MYVGYAKNGRCPTISSNSTRFDMYFTLCVCVCVFTTISNMDRFATILVELSFPQSTNQTYELNDFFSQKSSFLLRRALQYFKSVYTLYGIPLMTMRLFLSSIVIIMNSDVAYPCCQIFYRTVSCPCICIDLLIISLSRPLHAWLYSFNRAI